MSKFAGLALKTERPFRQLLTLPNGRPLLDADKKQAYIEVYSTDSEQFRAHQRAQQDSRMSGNVITIDEIEVKSTEALAAVTAGWYLVAADGTPIDIPFSRENAIELYSDPACAYIREQVSAGSANRANFIAGPSKP